MSDKNCPYAKIVSRTFLIFGGNNVRCTAQDRKRFTYFGTRYYPCEADNYRDCSYYLDKEKLNFKDRERILDEIGFGD